jgi:hypothetical protein
MTNIAQTMLSYMMKEIGKGYTEENPERFGPNEFDCSGLVYDAAKAAGIDIPQSDAIASSEAEYFSKLPGAQVIKNSSQVQAGDLVFFTGSSPDPSSFGPIGHVGIATNSTQYVSAYDTQEGVIVNPIGSGNGGFVVGVRLPGSVTAAADASGGGSILQWPGEITGFFTDADKFVTAAMWLASPGSWVRIGAFLAGVCLLLFAIHAMIAAANGEPLVKTPSVIPVPV